MKECMETAKPLVSILMAVYEPHMDWLKEQLDSLNAQTYPNLRLYIRDDCSPTVPHSEIRELAERCITAFPFSIQRNEENLGSNKTFERLTLEAEGDFFAYCDQDDVWLPEKLSTLEEEITQRGAQLVCSDMFIIDENGRQTAESITKVRRHHVFRSGDGLAPHLLISNFVTGCTMLLRAGQAKAAVPFCPFMVHDQYLALWCATKGSLCSLPQQLIRYRIHQNNQTLMMAGVRDKNSYCRLRIEELVSRLKWLRERFQADPRLLPEIVEALEWANARERNFKGEFKAKGTIIKHYRFSPLTSLFEVFFSGAPEPLFMFFIKLKRNNIL